MKRFAIALILCVALLSCSDTYYDGEYPQVYENEIYETGQPTITVVFQYGTPYYYGSTLYYYVYDGWYYYPYYHRGYWYYHRYHSPLPPPRWHHGGPARPGRPGSASHPKPGHFNHGHHDGGMKPNTGNRPRPDRNGGFSRGGHRPSGNGHSTMPSRPRPSRPSGVTGSPSRPSVGARIGGSQRAPQGHSAPRPSGGGRRH